MDTTRIVAKSVLDIAKRVLHIGGCIGSIGYVTFILQCIFRKTVTPSVVMIIHFKQKTQWDN